MKTRGDTLFILMNWAPPRCSHTPVAEQSSQSTEGLSVPSAAMPTRALFLAGVEGGFSVS